jgi:hypothetical protein
MNVITIEEYKRSKKEQEMEQQYKEVFGNEYRTINIKEVARDEECK